MGYNDIVVMDVMGLTVLVYDGLVLKERHPDKAMELVDRYIEKHPGLKEFPDWPGNDMGILLFAEFNRLRPPPGEIVGFQHWLPMAVGMTALYGVNPNTQVGLPIGENMVAWHPRGAERYQGTSSWMQIDENFEHPQRSRTTALLTDIFTLAQISGCHCSGYRHKKDHISLIMVV